MTPIEHAAVSGLESHLGYWLRLVSNQVSHAFANKVESHGVTVAEWVILRAMLDHDDLNPSQLAVQLDLSRGAVSKLIDRLVAKGLLRRRALKTDRRFQVVALSAAGRRLVPMLATLADENDRAFFGHLSDQDREIWLGLLRDLAARHGLRAAPMS